MVETKLISEVNEIALLHCLIKNENKLIDYIDWINEDSFGIVYHKQIMKAILTCFNNGEKIIVETLIPKLSEFCGGVLQKILEQQINIQYFDSYYSIIKEKEFIRKFKKLSTIIDESINAKDSTASKVEEIIREEFDEITKQASSNISLFGDNIFDVIPDPYNFDPNNKKEIPGVTSGIKSLDHYIFKFHNGCFTIIAGRPSSGKSEIVRNIFLFNSLQGNPVLFFSSDEAESIIKLKTISTITGIDYNHLKKQELTTTELDLLKKYLDTIRNLPFIVDTVSSLTITSIRSKIKKTLFKYPNLAAISVDYIQQMGVNTEEITVISQGLKKISKEFNLPIFAISQLSRNVENRQVEGENWYDPPLLSDLRQSGALEQDADKVLFIKAEPFKTEEGEFRNERKTRIWVAKQRDGIAGVYTDLINIGRIQTFKEIKKENPDHLLF